MDHLPLPKDASSPHIEVPFACTEIYDSSIDFTRYPAHKGWDQDSFFIEEFWDTHSSESVNALFQTWLYFGLLETFLGVAVDVDDFVTVGHDGDRAVVTSRALPEYLDAWRGRYAALDSATYRVMARRTQVAIFQANAMSVQFGKYRTGLVPERLDPAIALSIQLLGLTLCDAFDDFTLAHQTGLDGFRDDMFQRSDLVVERALAAGWCPNHIARFDRLMEQYYASSVPRRWRGRTHEKCSERSCIEDNINEAKYEIKHEADCERSGRSTLDNEDNTACGMARFSTDEICQILEGGHIPVIALSVDAEGRVSWRTVAHEQSSGLKYVTISHVWADGRGNPTQNSLPTCQLHWLHDLIATHKQIEASIEGSEPRPHETEILLWIDTICVPLNSDFRSIAIQRMARTYEEAECTFMIDEELRQACSKLNDHSEICVRIRGGRWMSRVWTYQEAMLSTNINFVLSDGCLPLDYLLTDGIDKGLSLARYAFPLATTRGRGKDVSNIGRSSKLQTSAQWFVQIWNNLASRSTSRSGDECICLATLIGNDPIPLLAEDVGQKRLCSLLDSCATVPGALLFAPGPHVRKDGHRWVPLSLLPEATQAHMYPPVLKQEVVATNTGAGIIIERPGILLATNHFDNSSLHVFSLENKWHLIANQPGDWDESSWQEVGATESTICAFIFQVPEWLHYVKGEEGDGAGALVTVSDYDSDMVVCTFKCRALIKPLQATIGLEKPSAFWDGHDFSTDPLAGVNESMVPMPVGKCYNEDAKSMGWIQGAKELGSGQKWYVR